MNSRRAVALVSVVLLMIVWGSTFLVTKEAIREVPPVTMGVLRFGIAALALGIAAVVRTGSIRLPHPFPLRPVLVMTLTAVTLFTFGLNYGMVYGSVTQGAVIYALTPAAVGLAAVLGLKERLSSRRTVGIVLSIVGVIVVVAAGRQAPDAPRPILAAVCMLVVVIGWAIYTVAAKRLGDLDQVVMLTWVTGIGTLTLIPFAGVELYRVGGWPTISLSGWLEVGFLGVIASGVAFIVYNMALRELDASVIGALSNLDPVVGVLSAVVFLGESLSGIQIGGAVAAMAGMWLASVEPARKARPSRSAA